MKVGQLTAGVLVVLVALTSSTCDRDPTSGMKGQTNTTLTFYGKVVDQDGKPLQGAQFEYRVEAYPKDWSFDTRGRENDVSKVSAVSNEQGLFQFAITGCQLVRMKAERKGYRHFHETDLTTRAAQTSHYRLIAWSDLWYKSDPKHPAVYVFVKDGVREVSALPCKGGYDSGGGTRWTLNKPAWPKKPSLPDVVYKAPSTNPATQP